MGRRRFQSLLLLNFVIATLADFTENCPQECLCRWARGNKQANCSNAHIKDLPKTLSTEIQNLDLAGNDLYEITNDAFYDVGLINLKKLVLRECKLQTIKKNGLSGLAIMIVLDLSKNDLKVLHPDTFKETVEIRWILLNDNKIEKLENGLFNNLSFLQNVDLSKNLIVTLGMKTFMNVPKLNILRLDGNKLEHLKIDTLSALTSLSNLDVHDNPWRCDCYLLPFRNWVISKNHTTIACAEPSKVYGKFWHELDSDDFVCMPSIVYPSMNTFLKTSDSNVTISCHVNGNPLPAVNWIYNSHVINESYRYQGDIKKYYITQTIKENSILVNLTIVEASSSDDGPYFCVATNPGGVEERVVTLAITPSSPRTVPPNSTRDGWPGYSYHDELHGWLKLHLRPTTWRAARISCHMEGAFLASPWTAKFSLSLKQLQSGSEQSLQEVVPALYSGFHTTSAEGAFTFENGKPAITLDHDGLAALERCVAYFVNGTSGGVDCDTLLPYVCYVPAPDPTPGPRTDPKTCPTPVPKTCPPSPPCPTSVPTTCPTPAPCPTSAPTTCPTPSPCPTPAPTTCPTPTSVTYLTPTPSPTEQHLKAGYEFVNSTGHWYKFHTEAKSWDDANRTCVEEGTHLAIINSKAEAEALAALLKTYKGKIKTASHTDCLFIGVHKDLSGVWRTVDGRTIEQAGYHEWFHSVTADYPVPKNNQGILYFDGKLFNGSDTFKLAFICEKN